jgi:hypothetical protein
LEFTGNVNVKFTCNLIAICIVYYTAELVSQSVADNVNTLITMLEVVLIYVDITCRFKSATEKPCFAKTWVTHEQHNFSLEATTREILVRQCFDGVGVAGNILQEYETLSQH